MKKNVVLPLCLLSLLALGFFSCVVEEPLVENPPSNSGSDGASTVAGIDSDRDGVRDDIQIHIQNSYTTPSKRNAVIQLTKAFQALLVNGGTKAQALAAGESLNRAIDCLYGLDPAGFGNVVDDIEGAVVNTEARTRAYAKAGSFLSGGSYPVSTVADNSGSCVEAP